jgi:hypothetical protein
MKNIRLVGLAILILFVYAGAVLQGDERKSGAVSYAKDVAPLLEKRCLPCHAEENANKSELFIDSYALLMKGGKHGTAVVPGKPDESDLVLKLQAVPPYGDRMPIQSRRKLKAGAPEYLSDEEVMLIRKWIAEGAKDN